MKIHSILFPTVAVIALLGASSGAFAASAEPEAFRERRVFSPEDVTALTDAHIAALKVGLKLTTAQEKNWPTLEAALRDVAKSRAARMTEWREKSKESHQHLDLIEGLRKGAKALTERAAEMEKIADAAKPLYESLDDAQKRRFGILFHALARLHTPMGGSAPAGHPDEHEGHED